MSITNAIHSFFLLLPYRECHDYSITQNKHHVLWLVLPRVDPVEMIIACLNPKIWYQCRRWSMLLQTHVDWKYGWLSIDIWIVMLLMLPVKTCEWERRRVEDDDFCYLGYGFINFERESRELNNRMFYIGRADRLDRQRLQGVNGVSEAKRCKVVLDMNLFWCTLIGCVVESHHAFCHWSTM